MIIPNEYVCICDKLTQIYSCFVDAKVFKRRLTYYYEANLVVI